MMLTFQQAAVICGLGSTIATALFWGALYLGRLTSRLERVEVRVTDQQKDLDELWRLARAAVLKP
jgi:hypothetical protein